MFVTEVNLWGAALIAFLVIAALIALVIVDRKMSRRMLLVYGVTLVQMILLGIVIWLVNQTSAWWSYLLWFLLITALSICWVLYSLKSMVPWKTMLLPVGIAMSLGNILIAGGTLLVLPVSVFMTVHAVLVASLTASLTQTMLNCLRGRMQNAQAQKQPLLESVLPKIRSMVTPLVTVVPTLYAGMLLGGIPALDGLLVALLLTAFAFVVNVVVGIVAQVL